MVIAMKNKSLIKIIVIIAALLVAVITFCWLALALGNPLSEHLARKSAEKILATGKYGDEYVVDEVYYQINDANYVAKIKNTQEPSLDLQMLFDDWGNCYLVCGADSYVQFVKAFLLKPSQNEEYPQIVPICSATELNQYIEENEGVYDLSEFKSAAEKYNEDYFHEKSLVLILTKESSGSTYYQEVSIMRKNKEVIIERATPVPFTEDLAYWHIIAEVEKDEPILTNSDAYNIWFTE